ALAPFAASAICGAKPFATMIQAWKYTLPAFVVPVVFCLSPQGAGLLFEADWQTVITVTLTSSLALAGFAIAAVGWIVQKTKMAERGLAIIAGVALIAPHPYWQLAGFMLLVGTIGFNIFRQKFRARLTCCLMLHMDCTINPARVCYH